MNLNDPDDSYYDSHRSMGMSAYWDGYGADTNPFTKGTPAHRAFALGWRDGRKEEKAMFGKNYVPIEEKREMLRVR